MDAPRPVTVFSLSVLFLSRFALIFHSSRVYRFAAIIVCSRHHMCVRTCSKASRQQSYVRKKPDQVIAPHFGRVFSYKHFVWASSCSLHTNTFYIICVISDDYVYSARMYITICITLTHIKKESDLIAIA